MLVCREAPYFDNMFNGSFKEAKAQECFLQEEEPFAFELFVCYIYANCFPDDIKAVCGVRFVYEPMIKFYVLADKLMMSKAAKTASLDALVKARAANQSPLNETTFKFVLAHTAEGCPMRKLVFNIICRDFLTCPGLDRIWIVSCLKSASFDQTVELLMALKHLASVKPTLYEDVCTKMVREKRSITSLPEYQAGYLKGKKGTSIKGIQDHSDSDKKQVTGNTEGWLVELLRQHDRSSPPASPVPAG